MAAVQNRKRLSWALFDTVFDGNSFRRREKVDVLDHNILYHRQLQNADGIFFNHRDMEKGVD